MSRSKLRPVSEFYSETSPKRQFNEIVVVRSYDLLNQKTKNSLPPFLMYLLFFFGGWSSSDVGLHLFAVLTKQSMRPLLSLQNSRHTITTNVQNSQIICSNKTVWKMKYAPEKQILWILQVFFFFSSKSALSRYQFKKKERKEQLCSSPKPLLALVRLEKVKEKAPSCFYQVEREMDIHRKAKHTVNYDFCCTFIQLLRT